MPDADAQSYRRLMSAPTEQFQIPLEVAEVYEAEFVPAIFADWAPHLVEAAGTTIGDDVLDVACGTGIVARTALPIVGTAGSVTGLDLNQAMLTVAERVEPSVRWRQGDAAALPFADDSFDVVVCQMALMFLPDRARAFAEMGRVARPDGRVGVVVPAALDRQPAYGPFVDIAVAHAGPEAESLLSTYWSCGDLEALDRAAEAAGLAIAAQRTRSGPARFASPEAFVATEVEGSPLRARISDATYRSIMGDVADALGHYRTGDGGFEIPLVGHILVARPG